LEGEIYNDMEGLLKSPNQQQQQRHQRQQKPPLLRRMATALAPAMNANVMASLLGIFVGVIPPIRAALFDTSGRARQMLLAMPFHAF
jgi:hypothetical protein